MVLADLSPKRYLSLCVIALGLAALVSACSPVEDKPAKFYRLPWLDSSGAYSIQDIELSGFREPDKLRGDAAEILVDPRISESGLVAEVPIGRWVRSGDSMTPSDSVTQQAAALYAHLEKLAEIDHATGADTKMNGRSKVGLLAKISESSSSPIILNNAVYDGHLDALFIVPYTGDYLAIALNGGIIGHEHFHRIFQSQILVKIREAARNSTIPYGWDETIHCAGGASANGAGGASANDTGGTLTIDGKKVEPPEKLWPDTVSALVPMKILNQSMVRGLNEGFADFWGWAYSHDEDFVARSLGGGEDAARRLDKDAVALPQKAAFRNTLITVNLSTGGPVLKSEGGRVGAAYRLGTLYARVLRGVVEALAGGGKISREVAASKVRMALAQSFADLSTDIVAKWGTEELDPDMLLKPVFSKLVKMSSAGPAVLEAESASVVCKELARLQASEKMLSGMCASKP